MVADAKAVGKIRVDRQLLRGVVRHDNTGRVTFERRLRSRLAVVRREAAHRTIGDLLVDAPTRMARILSLHQLRHLRRMHRVALPASGVLELGRRALNVGSPELGAQKPEHVIERSILEHQRNDVIDLEQVFECVVSDHPRRRFGAALCASAHPA